MLAGQLQRHANAAVLLRQILDEKPDDACVRVELALMQAALGSFSAAERELRAGRGRTRARFCKARANADVAPISPHF